MSHLTVNYFLDDILNVRLQTLGVMEHTFPINMGGLMYDWKLYDVGGAVCDKFTLMSTFDGHHNLWIFTHPAWPGIVIYLQG
jgi:hypothetical protein